MNFYMWGGCEIHDCIPKLNEQFNEHNFIQMGTTTIGSLFSKHGRIADATYEWYNNPNAKLNKYKHQCYLQWQSLPLKLYYLQCFQWKLDLCFSQYH